MTAVDHRAQRNLRRMLSAVNADLAKRTIKGKLRERLEATRAALEARMREEEEMSDLTDKERVGGGMTADELRRILLALSGIDPRA